MHKPGRDEYGEKCNGVAHCVIMQRTKDIVTLTDSKIPFRYDELVVEKQLSNDFPQILPIIDQGFEMLDPSVFLINQGLSGKDKPGKNKKCRYAEKDGIETKEVALPSVIVKTIFQSA